MAVSLVGGFLKQKSALKNKIKQEEIDFSLFSVFLNYFTFILFFFAELAVVTNFATFLLLFFRLFFSCFVGFFFAALAVLLVLLLLRFFLHISAVVLWFSLDDVVFSPDRYFFVFLFEKRTLHSL